SRARRGQSGPRDGPGPRVRKATKEIPVRKDLRGHKVRQGRRGLEGLKGHKAPPVRRDPRVTKATPAPRGRKDRLVRRVRRATRVIRVPRGRRVRPDLPAPPCTASSRASLGTITHSTCSSAVCGFRIRGLRSLVPTSLALSLFPRPGRGHGCSGIRSRSEEHTSELQSRENLVCRLLL